MLFLEHFLADLTREPVLVRFFDEVIPFRLGSLNLFDSLFHGGGTDGNDHSGWLGQCGKFEVAWFGTGRFTRHFRDRRLAFDNLGGALREMFSCPSPSSISFIGKPISPGGESSLADLWATVGFGEGLVPKIRGEAQSDILFA